MRPWWERWPEVAEAERAALRAATIPFDEEVLAPHDGAPRLRMTLWPHVGAHSMRLVADYPETFPYFPPQVVAPDKILTRHQHPAGGVLCLLADEGDWRAGDTLAELIESRLGDLLNASGDPNSERTAATERQQGEPYADYYPYRVGAAVLVDGSWEVPEQVAGDLVLAGSLIPHADGTPLLRATVLEVATDKGGGCRAANGLCTPPLGTTRLRGRWVRMPGPVCQLKARAVLQEVVKQHPLIAKPRPQKVGQYDIDVIGVVFPDELRWRQHGDNWVFVVQILNSSGKVVGRYFARAHRAGQRDLAERVPAFAPLAKATVAVFGLGAIGAPAALELARSGVGDLILIDGDYVDAATAARWPLGVAVAGLPKPIALDHMLRRACPHTRVNPLQWRLGGGSPDGYASELAALEQTVATADLVVDATTSVPVHHLLSDECHMQATPYLVASATPGGWGGIVARILPNNRTGCWACLEHHLVEGRIPMPPGDPDAEIQPAGCRSPTSTATGLDLNTVGLAAVRLGVTTLTADDTEGYPAADWDVMTTTFRDATRSYTGTWQSHRLDPAPECSCQAA